MVEAAGHFAMAFLWAFPAWFRWDGRASLAFVGFVLSTAMLPDVDLVLRHVLPGVHHHGVTHTVVFVAGVALVGGIVAAYVLTPIVQRCFIESEGGALSSVEAYCFVAGGLLIGGFSHLFADMLSAPDISTPVEPFWPFFDKPVSFDVVYYGAPEWNLGLLLVALVLHVVAGYADVEPLRRVAKR